MKRTTPFPFFNFPFPPHFNSLITNIKEITNPSRDGINRRGVLHRPREPRNPFTVHPLQSDMRLHDICEASFPEEMSADDPEEG